jgi:hypothetical protein
LPRNQTAFQLAIVLRWYFSTRFGRTEGPGTLPYYCDRTIVGEFAVSRRELSAGRDAALFRLFVAMGMFQARRDVVIKQQQRAMPRSAARAMSSSAEIGLAVTRGACPKFQSAEMFDEGCSVRKTDGHVDCSIRAGEACHVKNATIAINRMGDMGKLPTSAWLHLWRHGGVDKVRMTVLAQEREPTRRAALLVERFSQVFRVGRKLATMFVSALSTPALAPGLTPWFPEVDGNDLVVVDTNVARAVDALRRRHAQRTYGSRAQWVQRTSARLDLRRFHPHVPSHSPRLVQQALYSFCSKSNRIEMVDNCAGRVQPCEDCVPRLCPFALGRQSSIANAK